MGVKLLRLVICCEVSCSSFWMSDWCNSSKLYLRRSSLPIFVTSERMLLARWRRHKIARIGNLRPLLRKRLVVIECGFKHISLDGQEARLLGHLLNRDAGEIIDGLACLTIVPLRRASVAARLQPAIDLLEARCSCSPCSAAVVLFPASAIRTVAIDEATVANTSTATAATAAALCRRVQRAALFHAEGGRARIGSSLRKRSQILCHRTG